MTPCRAILFDMDGVLVDSEPLHAKAWLEVLAAQGVTLSADWFTDWIGIPDAALAAHLHEQQMIDLSPEAVLERKRKIYRRLVREELPPMPGVPERLEAIPDLPKAVVTSSLGSEARQTLEAVGLLKYFSVIIGADAVRGHKPQPEPYLAGAAGLRVCPKDCIVIEDSPAGVRAGRAAGCTVFAVTTSHAGEALLAADAVFATTADALDEALARMARTS